MTKTAASEVSIAVILPAYNEAATIVDVVAGFRAALPGAQIYVYDNNSTDETASLAAGSGAVVRRERMQGKGHVLRRAFADVDADVYVMADADGTYDAAAAPELVAELRIGPYDMVVGTRKGRSDEAYRHGHMAGNALFNLLLRTVFEDRFTDVFSGYRVLSRRFVKSFPSMSRGFEVETELSLHAIQLGAATSEIMTSYAARPTGSLSKLRTVRDGVRILWTLFRYLMHYRPFPFYGTLAGVLATVSLALGIPVVEEFMRTGFVPRIPTALLAVGIMLMAAGSFGSGLILDNIRQGLVELKRLQYLRIPPPDPGAAVDHTRPQDGEGKRATPARARREKTPG